MHLESIHLQEVGVLGDLDIRLADSPTPTSRRSRAAAVFHGAGGTGKSLLLAAISCTRPGNAVRVPTGSLQSSARALCVWQVSQEEPTRPHPISVTSPNYPNSDDGQSDSVRRREQAHYDKRASAGGFAFVGIPATRRFSPNPLVLSDLARSMATYDPRGGPGLIDPLRAELTRSIKQILAYSSLGASLFRGNFAAAVDSQVAVGALDQALREAMEILLAPLQVFYRGLDPLTFEPLFRIPGQQYCKVDDLPQQIRHLLAMSVVPIHHFWLAGQGSDPRSVEGVVAIDDVELHLTEATQERLLPALLEILPAAQWLLATAAWRVASAARPGEVIALRHLRHDEPLQCYEGQLGLTH